MKIVRENINFERGSEDPFRSLGVGHYDKIRREIEENPKNNLSDSMKNFGELVNMVKTEPLKLHPHLRGTFNKYLKDPHWKKGTEFLRDMVIDFALGGGEIQEKVFMDWVVQFTEEIDFDPRSLIQMIDGILYEIQMM